jgi:pyridoxamine 5'-phosphate oxidase
MSSTDSIAGIRKVYLLQSLLEKDVDAHPVKQFENWWQQVIESEIEEPNAMTLATCTASGKPSARIVLLKGVQENGFVFFTNYMSRKGREIESNPYVSLLFYWKELERQVSIEGHLQRISEADSDDYFSKRPLESRIGAWSSPQSEVINDRNILYQNVADYTKKFDPGNIPRPPFWGGYIVKPTIIEFWQGRPARLHDRLQYSITEDGSWKIERLAP